MQSLSEVYTLLFTDQEANKQIKKITGIVQQWWHEIEELLYEQYMWERSIHLVYFLKLTSVGVEHHFYSSQSKSMYYFSSAELKLINTLQ